MHDEREAHDERDDTPGGGGGATEVARLEERVETGGAGRAFPALAEAYRRDGRPTDAERVAREGLRRVPSMLAGRVALGLALLDQGRTGEARSELERVLDQVPDHALARDVLAREHPAENPEARPSLEASPSPDRSTVAEEPEEVAPADERFVPPGVAAAPNRLEFDRAMPEASFDAAEPEPASGPRSEPAPEESFAAIAEDEIDSAFAAAEPERDQLVDADRIAQQAIESVQEMALDGPAEVSDEDALLIAEGSPLATRTMADLLERQGHTDEAESMRRAAATREHPAAVLPQSDEKEDEVATEADTAPRDTRSARMDTLNRWLRNARRRQG